MTTLTLCPPLPVEDAPVVELRPPASSSAYAAHLAEQVVASDPVFAMEFASAILQALPCPG